MHRALDGDLQNDPADIPRLLAEIERGADLVCGYRARRADSLSKKITSRVANFVRSRFVGDGVRDTGCTLKAMRRECAAALVPFKGVHRFIPALVKNAGYTLAEIPVNHRPRQYGVSKYGLGKPRPARDDGYVWRALAPKPPPRLHAARGIGVRAIRTLQNPRKSTRILCSLLIGSKIYGAGL